MSGESGRQQTPLLQLFGSVHCSLVQHSTQASEPGQVRNPWTQKQSPFVQTEFASQYETQTPSSPQVRQLEASHPAPVAGQHWSALTSMQSSPQAVNPVGQTHAPCTQVWLAEQA
jgi:hypothetical protein